MGNGKTHELTKQMLDSAALHTSPRSQAHVPVVSAENEMEVEQGMLPGDVVRP